MGRKRVLSAPSGSRLHKYNQLKIELLHIADSCKTEGEFERKVYGKPDELTYSGLSDKQIERAMKWAWATKRNRDRLHAH